MNIGERIMLEMMSTEAIIFPIMNQGKLLVDDDFLKLIVEISNSKLDRVWDKINRLEKTI